MTKIATALAALSVSAVMALGAPAYASHGGDDPAGDDHGGSGGGGGGGRVVKTGSCTDGAHWKLKVKNDDGRLEVEGEVDSNVSGQSWRWKIKDNGTVAASGSSKTGGRSGSFSVERKISNRAGTDKITFRATHSGEVCSGSIAF
ncbi:MAG TPA: hypothetical protein VFV89_12880 [Nocardioides sp.]|uniref:hypothetical protein n=1 Tax=Nocardioides sp. TaxID=35761 RepID=UPI002E2F1519|nr:hypothetical protein [Nocardioides sp.]HEX5088698.1 hypothetical protein [Nocardioides sp.]